MQTIIGLLLIVGIAYGLLRLLAWLGQSWERGPLQSRPSDHEGANGWMSVLSVDGRPKSPAGLEDITRGLHRDMSTDTPMMGSPKVNVDGAPMISAAEDIFGKPYGQ